MADTAERSQPGLNPAQQRALDLLRTRGVDRPEFPAGLAEELRGVVEDALCGALGQLDEPLWVGKFALGRVHGCEVRFLHEDGRTLTPGPALVAGTVAHRAIQLSVTWRGDASPLELVDAAVERIEADGDRDSRWLAQASPAEQAEVVGTAAERVGKFLECFPPLRRTWAPATESPLRALLADGQVVLTGRVDLVLGRSQGMEAGKAFVDFKTGVPYLGHVEDLRFYALVETLRLGVPPFRLASYYLDGAVLHCEDVTVDLLHAAARRVGEGVRKLVALRAGEREPVLRPGPGCRRCPLLADCAEGRAHLADEELG
ncbi:MAG: hypothetical protein GEV08_04790 [Acidimicrobiia bacterium]|nr:hypothetical protein [Acidimicrobiia bacterium]